MDSNILKLCNIIKESNNIVFFGGAGVSVESGIPDFRSSNGLYNEKSVISPEEILSHTFFMNNTKDFYKFYKSKMIYKNALPNPCHLVLKKLEDMGKLKCIITQNIDNLHSLAGCKNVYELHGSVYRNYCMKCNKYFDVDYVLNSNDVPICDYCKGIIKPDVVLYEEGLNEKTIIDSINAISSCDTLIIGGTSLAVYPANGLIRYFKGKNLVIINKSVTQYDKYADVLITDNIGKVFKEIEEELNL